MSAAAAKSGAQDHIEPVDPTEEASIDVGLMTGADDEAPKARVEDMMRSAIRVTRARLDESAQADELTNGEACLAEFLSALGWSGDPRRLVEALPHVDAVRTLDDIADAAARLDYDVELRREPLQSIDESAFPAVVEFRGRPVVALQRNEAGAILVRRSALGLTEDADDDPETSNAPNFVRVSAPRRSVRILFARPRRTGHDDREVSWTADLLHESRDQVVGALVLTLAANVFAVSTPLFAMAVYNMIVPSMAGAALAFVTALAALALLTEHAIWRVRNDALAVIGGRAHRSLVVDGLHKVMRLPLGMIENLSSDSQIAQLKRLESFVVHLQSGLAGNILDLPFVLVFIIALAVLGGPLALIPTAAIVLFLIMAVVWEPLASHAEARGETARREARELLRESVLKARSVRAIGAERVWLRRLETSLSREAAILAREDQAQQVAGHVGQGVLGVASALTLGFGAYLAMDGSLSVGALIAISMLTMKSLSPVHALFLSLRQMRSLRRDARMIDNLMRMKDEGRDAPSVRPHRRVAGALRADRLGYRYAGKSDVSLRQVSFDLAPGQHLGVIGPAGSGKSTLLRIALGLTHPMVGAVTLDGLPLTQLAAAEHRRAFAYAPDRPHLFYGTVAQNLRLGRHDASEDEMGETLEALEVVLSPDLFPDGLETRLSAERRVSLGVATLQKLNLARALLSARPVLILDDPTAELDAPSCAALAGQLARRRGSTTTIVATANRALLSNCDKILALSRGEAVASGPADEVLQRLLGGARR